MNEPGFDAAEIVHQIEAEARRRRASSGLPEDLVAELDRGLDVSAELDAPEEYAVLQSARPLRSSHRGIGPHVVRTKRIVRRLLAWYIHPITADQTRFNLAILRELRELEGRLRWLEPPLEAPVALDEGAADAHARRLFTLLGAPQRLRVVGGDADLRGRLLAAGAGEATAMSWGELATSRSSSVSCLLFVDALDRMTGAQALAALPLAIAALEVGGTAMVDLAAAGDPALPVSDIAAQRSLTADAVAGLFRAAGFVAVAIEQDQGRVLVSGQRRDG